MGILSKLKQLFAVAAAPEHLPRNSTSEKTVTLVPSFVPSFKPFKPERKNTAGVEKRQQEEWEVFGQEITKDTYPHGYGIELDSNGDLTGRFKEKFRSKAEIDWAKAFDRVGLQWEYEPLKFDMGSTHFSYTPDFRIRNLSAPDSSRDLYIEIKQFPHEEMDLTKYVRFTAWYDCDLLVLAHEKCDAGKKGNVIRPQNRRYFLVLRCTHCDTYEWFPCDHEPTDNYIRLQNLPSSQYIQRQEAPGGLARGFPLGYKLSAEGTFWLVGREEPPPFTILDSSSWSEAQQREYWENKFRIWKGQADMMPFRNHPSACLSTPFERMTVPNYFLIQGGKLNERRVLFVGDGIESKLRLEMDPPP